ncbi:cytochrome c oxidase subunit II [Maricaulis sp.]|jgi:cytochrome c oxidase subunit 2|uniref:cytochrome c oxidase subunit II n=1 Tax=Maricaulis sp. TaxID=1486257 RepID=UPI0025C716BA|nr:cytochrome c oxidase subunit II [Maricaulis sp.]
MRFLTALVLTWTTAAAGALATPGQPTDGHLGFQPAVTPIMERVTSFHNILLWIIIPITIFVMGLLLWVMIRYNRKANPQASKNSHNTLLEVVWTAVPVMILIVISVFSFPLLYFQDEIPEADFTIKATGYQWYWGYEYPDHEVPQYISTMVAEEDLSEGQLRNLSVDYPLVVPVDAVVRLQVTAADVIHNWAMPSFGTKMDAIPGRINEAWFQVTEEGTYYGQCSELCGIRHAFMPIEVHVVSQDTFDAWVEAGPGSDEANAVIAEYSAARETRLAQLD